MREKFNDHWFFHKEGLDSINQLPWEIKDWQRIDIPHDWMIYQVKDLYENSIGYYKKIFDFHPSANRQVLLRFDGVYMDTTIYLNGKVIYEWKYGYSTFEVDLTEHIKEGKNELYVRCVYRNPNSRWYSGAGIYRNVWLIDRHVTHFASDGIYISTHQMEEAWQVTIDSEIEGMKEGQKAEVRHTLKDFDGNEVASVVSECLSQAQTATHTQLMNVYMPKIWNIGQGNLYQMTSELIIEGKVIDEIEQNIGFKTMALDPNEGFFLNGRHLVIKGVCQHHDLGALGAAVNKEALKRQFETLQEMGVNAIRTAHNMPDPLVMELADEMGLLIYSESFDMWEDSKTDYDYGLYFKECWERDIKSWVKRDRNHVSLMLWGIGNEIFDTRFEKGEGIAKKLCEAVRKWDPRKNGFTAIGSNFIDFEEAQRCSEHVDAAGYNYKENLYDLHHEKYPHWCIFGSETASTVQSRGIYHFPLSNRLLTYEDGQCSSLGNCSTNWGAKDTDEVIVNHRERAFCFGQFIWTGWDYIGEPTPYFSKNSFFGQIDTAGFKKDTFYNYQAEWTDYKISPMIHLLPYWDFNEGQLIDICVASNAPMVELFIDGVSLGKQEIDHAHGKKLRATWQLPYRKGTLKAVAYDEVGKVIAMEEKTSFTDPVKIALKPNKTQLLANGEDLIFVEITTVDEKGIEVANGRSRIEVSVTGAGRLVGLDNGDSTDYDEYKGTSRKLFSGKLLAIIAAKTESGEIQMKCTSIGLQAAELSFQAVACPAEKGISAWTENELSPENEEVPVRKIELSCSGARSLNPEHTEVTVEAHLYPENTTYQDIEFKALTLEGIESNSVKCVQEGKTVKLVAKGDGAFRLCAIAKNGSSLAEVMSELEFEVTGMGKACLDPYGFVSGCQFTKTNHPNKLSFQGGVFVDTDDTAEVTFEEVDFGEFGSDEITLPIFTFLDEVPIEIWQGVPNEGGTCLLKAMYRAKSWYNHYQPNTYVLPNRLKGLQTLTIVIQSGQRISLQGFSFKKLDKAFSTLFAVDNTRITGDSFKIEEEAITQIGNNVTLEYHHMDFGEKGLKGITLCGRSHIPVNTIHIYFVDDKEHTITQSIDIPYSEDYQEWHFELEQVKGNQKVNFIFLPGSKFDFKYFKFE